MLFRSKTLDLIKKGKVTIAFRKWKRPTVKEGGTLITRAGMLRIEDITPISLDAIKKKELTLAGYENKNQLAEYIKKKKEGILYKISFHLEGEDPRIALREVTELSTDDFNLILEKLERLDQYSREGPWTFQILNLIEKHPQRLAKELADEMGVEKAWFKPNVRKLKKLGLTISHKIGYTISPRGKAFVDLYQSKL